MNNLSSQNIGTSLDFQESPGEFEEEEEREEDDSSEISSLPPLTQVATASPRMIVSPKMQNIHLIIQNEDNDSSEVNTPHEDWHANLGLGIQSQPLRNERNVEEHYRTRAKRQTILWAENQAEEDTMTQERVRAEAELQVKFEGARAKAEARAEAEASSRAGLSTGVNGANRTVEDTKSTGEQDEMTRKTAERERRLRAEKERLLIEEDARKKAVQVKLEKEKEEEEEGKAAAGRTTAAPETPEDQEAQRIAVEIVQGIYKKISHTEYANFLGTKENHRILKRFIILLEPLPNSLVLSLYKLVTRIYFIAEAQAIDRILEELSIRWTTTNPATHWGSHYNLCHIVLFSLLILNSDLHNAENNQPKFSKEEFTENTLFAVEKESSKSNFDLAQHEPGIREELGVYYEALKYMSLPLLKKDENKTNVRDSRDSKDTRIRIRRRNSKMSTRSQLNNSTENSSSDDDTSVISSSSPSARREPHYTSNWKFHHNKPLPRLYRKEPLDEVFVFSNGTSWCVDSGIKMNERDLASSSNNKSTAQRTTRSRIPSSAGGIFRWITRSKSKSLLHGNKSPVAFFDGNTKWINVRCRVCEGRIYVFKHYPPSMGPQNSMQDLDGMKKASDVYFVCSLYESLATLVQDNVVVNNNHEPSRRGDLDQRGNFTVIIPASLHRKKTLLEFQTSNVEEAQRFVQCVNFWAARLTPVPTAQFEIVSNEENGWSPQVLSGDLPIETLETLYLSDWRPLLSISHLYSEQENSTEETNMVDKIEVLESFAEYLQRTIDSHNTVKPLMISRWRRTRNFERAMDNWNKKYLYLNELNERTSVYLNALQLAQRSVKH
ncbi:hypothetical protein ZYGR_0E01430 [Zygosaccharomyces rouxii]|uniref:Guanine-nucleotide exchange factor YEL1 n=1 Tax=Zygosaccharomyces rouxii TaxID=4956 RepID=A0A1Q2ZUZ0_ZYGRO|nr:hypothetical protein ZYGR_0E01430 [Zygosaccharomyces rouxii]